MQIRKIAIALALVFGAAAAAQANASGINGAAGITGSASSYSGTITGSTANVGSSNSIAAAQTNGYGTSYQAASNTGTGISTAGGSISPSGVTTSTSQYTSSVSQTAGSITGNSPISGSDGSIMNGSSAFGQTTVANAANGTFQTGKIGGSLNVSGFENYNTKGFGF